MTEIAEISPSDREHYESSFRTTSRKQFHYFVASLTIIPAYITLIAHVARLAAERFSDYTLPGAEIVLHQMLAAFSLVALFPHVLSALAINHPHWRTGITHRGLVLAVALFWTFYFLYEANPHVTA